jgi:hypothetical protein
MALPLPETLFDAERISRSRTAMPTDLSTAELRELGAEVLARSVFTARGTSAVFASKIKDVVDEIAAGRMSDSQARAALFQTLQVLGYDVEAGGFEGEEVEPALRGTLQDLESFRRLDLIVRTQRQLMQGAGEQWRGLQPDRLEAFPALELIRIAPVTVARDWPARWKIATGKDVPAQYAGAHKVVGAATGMILFKGDPGWGELGSYDNFPDALGVDHSPFYFNSEMWTREVPRQRVLDEGITGPNGETIEEFFGEGSESRQRVMAGKVPTLPATRMSLDGVAPELIEKFKAETFAVPVTGKASTVDYSDRLARSIAARSAARQTRDEGGVQ